MMDYIRNPAERGQVNRSRVFDFFRHNPCHTNRACAEALDLSVATVGNHSQAIRDGWRPDGFVDPSVARNALVRIAEPSAFFVATSDIDPEAAGRMWLAQFVLDGVTFHQACIQAEDKARNAAQERRR